MKVKNRDMSAAWRHVDLGLCFFVAVTVIFGSFMIYSTTSHRPWQASFITKHILFVMVGTLVMVGVAAVDYVKLQNLARVIYLGSLALLVVVLTPLGWENRGIQAWFKVGGNTFQPAEVAKLGVIISVAAFLGSEDELGVRETAIAVGMFALPCGLIMLQPDLGTTLVFLFVLMAMMLAAQIPVRYLVTLVMVGVLGVGAILGSGTLAQYQTDRLTSFLSADSNSPSARKASYNTRQSQQAISLGGLTGEGFLKGEQTKGGYVPEQHTDFIFTVPGEELGFAGSSLLLVLLAGIIWRIWRTAQLARDRVGALMCIGVLAMFMFHIFENVGMNMGIMPVTGIPLPFVSYGGSSTIVWFACMGVVLNVHMRRFS